MRSIQSVYEFSSPRAKGFLVGEAHILVDEDDKAMVDALVSRSNPILLEGEAEAPSGIYEFSDSNPFYLKRKGEIDAIRQEYAPKVLSCFLQRTRPEEKAEVEGYVRSFNPVPLFQLIAYSLFVPARDRQAYLEESLKNPKLGAQSSIMYAKPKAASLGKSVLEVETMEEKAEWMLWNTKYIQMAYQFFAFEHLAACEQERLRELFQEKDLEIDKIIVTGSQDEATKKRDERFIAEIAKLEGNPLVMLGAAHLPGVMAGLQKQGYAFQARYSG